MADRRPQLLAAVWMAAAGCGTSSLGGADGAALADGALGGDGSVLDGSASADSSAPDAAAIDAPSTAADAAAIADAIIWIPDASPDASPGPAAACSGLGAGGHLQLVSAYWASSDAFGDHLGELAPALQAGHIDVARLAQPPPGGVDVIVDLHWELFDYASHTVRPDLATRLAQLAAAVAPVRGRVRAFYLIDEPYIAGHLIPRTELEVAIAAVESEFAEIPTYITFAHHCFDPASTDPACQVPGANRGIPAGLTWVGFDWYNDSNDLAQAATHVPSHVATGIARIGALAPSARVVIVPEAYTDGNRLESTAVATLHDYFALAAETPSVFAVDFFLWPDVPPPESFLGMRSLPAVRAATRSFGRWVRKECGDPVDRIPITQWYSAAGPDYRYEPWVWNGRAHGYRVDGVAFALVPAGSAGAVPLYHCLIDRGSSVDSYLTADSGCDGAPVIAPGSMIGATYTSQQPGTVALHRYVLQTAPWDHAYALSPTATLPAGYQHEFAIGWVYPPSAL